MQKKLIIPAAIIFVFLLYSCGPSKKLQSANAQVEQLQADNSKLKTDGEQLVSNNAALQKQVDNLTASNKSVNDQFSQYKSSCEKTKKELEAMQATVQEQRDAMKAVKMKLETALADFKDKGVEVYEKNGNVYVDMQDNLLYKSGSAKMGEDGKKALAALASALNDYPNLKVIVVGHTDNVKFKNSNNDNLSLSTERANGVVRILRDSYSVDPTRMTAAGKGKYDPVADNSTKEGKAKNRRTEIILNPDLMKIWESSVKSN
jgi:chemotaxis protein MotB